MPEIDILFENQIREFAVAELISKHQKEFEEIKNKLRNEFTIKVSDFKSFLKDLEKFYKREFPIEEVEVYFANGTPEYLRKGSFIYRIEKQE